MKTTKLWLVLAAGVALTACNMAPFPLQAERFACQADSECASTYVCIDGECRVPGVSPGGDAGTGTPDAGNRTDAGTTDAGTTDAGTTDAGVTDAGTTPDAGSCTPTAEVCGDGIDNDCDTKVDCADTQCNQQCGPGCVCEGPTARELSCNDGEDNDSDGKKDCEDSDCSAHSCGTGCVCSSQVKAEVSCADGADNDGDQLTDCMDPDCAGESINGVVCTGAASGNVRGQSEGSCYISTASDNDGDSKPNCEDPDCWGRACTVSGSCFCQNGVPREIVCTGADDDNDGKLDNQDPDCCGATGAGVVTMDPGVCTGIETNCYDGQDDNGTGGIDCADPTCAGRACNDKATCVCMQGEKHEIDLFNSPSKSDIACNVLSGDEDGDGLANCADPDCNSKLCSGSGCWCVGTTPAEANCNDGKDNDNDKLTDCADPDCVGATSGSNGVVCADLKPTCSGNGGLTDTSNELMCSDGFDNNCNGQKDGSDLACTVTSEANCSNGTDDDGDGKPDCEDSDCQGHTCVAGSSASVCCGIGPNATQCKDITQDEGNCGGCGVSCSSGEQCQPVTAGGVTSGQCTCSSAGCPTSGGGITEAQTCSGGLCICTGTGSAGQCATNAACTAREGLTSASAGFCHYP